MSRFHSFQIRIQGNKANSVKTQKHDDNKEDLLSCTGSHSGHRSHFPGGEGQCVGPYSATGHFAIPVLKSGPSGRHMSTAPAISKSVSAPHDSPLSKFFDSDFFKPTVPTFARPSELMQLSKLLTPSGIGSIVTISAA